MGEVVQVQLINNSSFIQTYQTLFAAIFSASIIVVGWVINHMLTIKAQREKYIDELYNTVRIEILTILREYDDYLNNLEKYLTDLENRLEEDKINDWDLEIQKYRLLLSCYKHSWKRVLEQYNTLLPELVDFNNSEFRSIHYSQSFIESISINRSKKQFVSEQLFTARHLLVKDQGEIFSLSKNVNQKCFSKITRKSDLNKVK